MKKQLRILGSLILAIGIVFLVLALLNTGGKPKTGGQLTCKLTVREKLISGAYKVYGAQGQPISIWLAKTVFRNETPGHIRNMQVRYKLGEYAEWCSWQTYPAMVPTETVVDLYYPILSEKCAKLDSRAPAELQMECEYTDPEGKSRSIRKSQRLTILGKREFYFNDLSSHETTGSFQDFSTYSDLLAAWVTKADPPVAGLASLANKLAGGVGASQNVENCVKVMEQLYEIMRAIHITYQYPAVQQEKNKSFDMMLIQSLQYPRDTIQKRSGTCIDLAILYAAMMESVSIKSILVSLDGHVFPMAELPNGVYLPVESTCVGGGGELSNDFATAVKIAQKQWQDLQQNGRFVLTDCRKCWSSGISPPELDPMPADILERWGITENSVRAAVQQPAAVAPGGAQPAAPDQPAPTPQPQKAAMVPGPWRFSVAQMDGSQLQGTAQVSVQGGQVQIVFTMDYTLMGPDGLIHYAHEQNSFTGQIQGQQLTAQCLQAVWTLDGQQVPPSLPVTIRMAIANGGRGATGTVTTAQGYSAQMSMQAM